MLKKTIIVIGIIFAIVLVRVAIKVIPKLTSDEASVPQELIGTWYSLDKEEYEVLSFTKNRIIIDDDITGKDEYRVRITDGKRIEYADPEDKKFDLGFLFCRSYSISGDVLTFTGGMYDGESFSKNRGTKNNSTKNKSTENKNGDNFVPSELRGIWQNLEENEYEVLNFTENRLIIDDDITGRDEYIIRVTGKQIEYADIDDKNFEIGILVCRSYTISGDVLTFTGGMYNGESFSKKGTKNKDGANLVSTKPKGEDNTFYLNMQLQSVGLKQNFQLQMAINDKDMAEGFVLYEGQKERMPIHFYRSENITESDGYRNGNQAKLFYYNEIYNGKINGVYSLTMRGTSVLDSVYYVRQKDKKMFTLKIISQ